MMKKILMIAALICGLGLAANAQSYKHSIGVTVGFMNGIAYKGFLGRHLGLQVDASYNVRPNMHSGFYVNPNIMYQAPIASSPIEWFVGGGLGIGNGKGFFMGMNSIGGIEYAFDFPLVLSTDIRLGVGMDSYDNDTHSDFQYAWNISARYIIK